MATDPLDILGSLIGLASTPGWAKVTLAAIACASSLYGVGRGLSDAFLAGRAGCRWCAAKRAARRERARLARQDEILEVLAAATPATPASQGQRWTPAALLRLRATAERELADAPASAALPPDTLCPGDDQGRHVWTYDHAGRKSCAVCFELATVSCSERDMVHQWEYTKGGHQCTVCGVHTCPVGSGTQGVDTLAGGNRSDPTPPEARALAARQRELAKIRRRVAGLPTAEDRGLPRP